MPFDSTVVADYRDPPPPSAPPPEAADDVSDRSKAKLRKTLGLTALGVGAIGLGAGTFFSLSARAASTNTAGIVSFVVGGAAVGTGLVLLLWPSAPKNVQVSWSPGGGRVGYVGSF
jgi:hypothetical protein